MKNSAFRSGNAKSKHRRDPSYDGFVMVNEAAPQRETVEPNESAESLTSSHEQVELEGLARDIACPNCEYNLRGILGDPVVCPECGNAYSVSKLLELRWNKLGTKL